MLVQSEEVARREAVQRAFWNKPLREVLAPPPAEVLEASVLGHFHDAAREVPAYRKFLEGHGVEPRAIRSLRDFATLPITTKQNYQQAFPLAELCRQGTLHAADMLAVSSGSTGTPAIWPRSVSDELHTTRRFEQVLCDAFHLDERRTLAVVCFALGSWVGGMYTTACCRHLAIKGYPLTTITPGNNKAEILRVLEVLAPDFEQIVLLGYPPFLKDVVDSGRAAGFAWQKYAVRLIMAGEVFSEEWRSLVCERLGSAAPELASASLYGTADGGVLANETATSIRVRRYLARKPALARQLFGEARLPTLCQYDPLHRYFEVDTDQLLFSADGAVPLMRYKILDKGGIIPYAELLDALSDTGFNPLAGLSRAELDRTRQLPFVFVFGRSSFAVSFYGANVYPENVAVGLETAALAEAVTGKFVMSVAQDADLNSILEIRVELAHGITPSIELSERVARSIRHELERLNSEFANYAPAERRTPRVELRQTADPEWFPPGVKHRSTR